MKSDDFEFNLDFAQGFSSCLKKSPCAFTVDFRAPISSGPAASTAVVTRVQALQAPLYRDHQDRLAQHEPAVMEMVASHVSDRQLQQGDLFGGAGAVDRCHSANGVANRPCDPKDDGPGPCARGARLLHGIVEMGKPASVAGRGRVPV